MGRFTRNPVFWAESATVHTSDGNGLYRAVVAAEARKGRRQRAASRKVKSDDTATVRVLTHASAELIANS
jgi:hypothetical protein